ncbi:MAG: hypothetical protein ABI054_08445, partial [Planctomycetota bacterium]
MKNRSQMALAALIVLGALAQAQNGGARPANGLDNVQLALDSWRAEHGANWQIKFDDATGYARFIYGGNAAPMFTPHQDSDYLVLARQAARDTYELHGIEASTLVDDEVTFLPLSNAGSSDKMTVQFRQVVGGVPVEHGFLNVLFDRNGRVLSIDTTALAGVAGMLTSAGIQAERASAIARSYFIADTGLEPNVLTQPELVIFRDPNDELGRGVLCWKAGAQNLDLSGEALGFTYHIDANNGRRVDRENAIHHMFDVSGNVKSFASPGTKPDEASNVAAPINIPNMVVVTAQGNATTDANGDFNIVGATAPVSATFKFSGPFANVINTAGAAYSQVTSLTLASGNNVVLNSPAAPLVTAQANGMNWWNKERNWIRSIIPADSHADFVNTINTNIGSSCNAYYNGSSTNFYQVGGGCVNTCYADVVAHESGHWLNDKYSSGNGSDGFGEGNADNFGLYLSDQPILGADFSGVGSMIRSGNNTRQFCGDSNGGCYGEVHNDGEVLMGACWKVRVNLKNSLGASAGAAAADTIFLSWMNAYNDSQIKTIVETHWLTLDDNDGNLLNGTPNFAAIEGGFRVQGFPQMLISLSNVTVLPDTTNVSGPYTVDAHGSAPVSGPLTMVLKYRTNGGVFNTLPMSFVSGDLYTANIPGQP